MHRQPFLLFLLFLEQLGGQALLAEYLTRAEFGHRIEPPQREINPAQVL